MMRRQSPFKRLTPDGKGLLAVLSVLGFLCIVRAYHLWVTGFFVSDEYGYIFYALHNPIGSIDYSRRYFIAIVNESLFRLFGVTSVDRFIFFLPFYLFLWSGMTVFFFYEIMRSLEFGARIVAASLLTCLFLMTFVLFSLGFLTESPGLAMTMLGLLFVLKFVKAKGATLPLLGYPFLASLSFAAATYTREPYFVYLIGGIAPITIIAWSHRRTLNAAQGAKRYLLLSGAVLLFAGPSIFFFNYPGFTGYNLSSLATLGSTPQANSPFLLIEGTSTATSSVTNAIGIASATPAGVGTQSLDIGAPSPELFRASAMFLLGLLLGWGPIPFGIALLGIGALILTLGRRGNVLSYALVMLVLLGFASYFLVSFFLSSYPEYVTSLHFSTLIRFSNTALPAYFLAAPFALSILASRRRALLSLFLALTVFTIAILPAYQLYASTGLGVQGNPFSLGYISPANPGVVIRNYVTSHPGNGPFFIMGFSNDDWWWVPGNTFIISVHFFPYLSQAEFVQQRWPVVYLWGTNETYIAAQSPYMSYLLSGNVGFADGTGAFPFIVSGRESIFNGSHVFVKVTLSWAT